MNKELKGHTLRFLDIIDNMNISHSYLCENVYHKKPSYLSNVKSGRQDASIEMIVGFIEAYPNVSANYILTGRGSMFIENIESSENDEVSRINRENQDKILQLHKDLESAWMEIGKLRMELNKKTQEVKQKRT